MQSFISVPVLSLGAVFGALVIGGVAVLRDGDFNGRCGNRLMFARYILAG